MRWKYFWILLGMLLLLSGVSAILVWRAEWFFHVVAQKEFPYPSDAPHPHRLIAEIRRRYPEHDWRSLLRKSPAIYMEYECRLRDENETLTSSFWVFADDPHPSGYTISTQGLDTNDSQVMFQVSDEIRRCKFAVGDYFCWTSDSGLQPPGLAPPNR